jgi:hypothetical protein
MRFSAETLTGAWPGLRLFQMGSINGENKEKVKELLIPG